MKRGFITPLILFVSCIVMIMLIHVNYITTLESKIAIAAEDKIQTQYLSDTKINRIIYDDNYYNKYLEPAIKDYLKSPMSGARKTKITIEDYDLDPQDKKKSVNIEFINDNNRRYIELIAESDYRGIKSISKERITYVNSIFEEGSLPLISYDLDINTCKDLNKFYEDIDEFTMDHIPSDFKKLNTFHHNEIQIEAENNSKDIIRKISSSSTNQDWYPKNSSSTNRIFFDIKNKIYTPVSLRIIDKPNLDPIKLKGVIIIEGDLIIEKRFDFSGIIILKGQDSKIIVESKTDDYKPIIRGIILTEGKTDFLDSINLKYDREAIGMYGFYLPNFIEIK